MQRDDRYPFKTTALLLILILPFLLVCSRFGEQAPGVTEEILTEEDLSEAEVLFHRASASFEAERWSVSANQFDRLLAKYPETEYTSDALILATTADLRAEYTERATRRLLDFQGYIVRELSAGFGKSTDGKIVLVAVAEIYADVGLRREGLSLMMDLLPPDFRARELGDRVYDTAEYFAYQLPADVLEELIASYPQHVLTPVLRIHLARKALLDGDAERTLALLSEIKVRSLREEERSAVREIRARASGRGAVEGKVALLLPFTGKLSQYGRAVLEGVQLALHPLAKEVEVGLGFEIFDTGGEISELMETIEQIIQDSDILGIIGPLSSSLTIAATHELQGEDITLISPTASEISLHELSGNVFSLNVVDESLATRIAEFAVQDLGLRDFAAVFPMDDYGYRMVKAFIDRVEVLGGRMLIVQGYPISATTFDVELKRVRYYAPEAIFLPAHSEEIPVIAPQIPFYGMEEVQLLGTNGWNNRRVARLGGKYVEGAFFTDTFFEESSRIAYREFSRRYEEIYQREASRVAGLGYDAVNLIRWGLRVKGGSRRSRKLDFTGLENFRGATAVYTVNDEGDFEKEPLLLTISGGKIRPVEELPPRETIRREKPTFSPADPLEPQLEPQ